MRRGGLENLVFTGLYREGRIEGRQRTNYLMSLCELIAKTRMDGKELNIA